MPSSSQTSPLPSGYILHRSRRWLRVRIRLAPFGSTRVSSPQATWSGTRRPQSHNRRARKRRSCTCSSSLSSLQTSPSPTWPARHHNRRDHRLAAGRLQHNRRQPCRSSRPSCWFPRPPTSPRRSRSPTGRSPLCNGHSSSTAATSATSPSCRLRGCSRSLHGRHSPRMVGHGHENCSLCPCDCNTTETCGWTKERPGRCRSSCSRRDRNRCACDHSTTASVRG
mmetsp:Transcript_116873/g.277640  ORF Transcript_116873/g.277640 Transcript_116873/m.277640 type:complete len:224 (-) Transcript_116873:1485-2156(-)